MDAMLFVYTQFLTAQHPSVTVHYIELIDPELIALCER